MGWDVTVPCQKNLSLTTKDIPNIFHLISPRGWSKHSKMFRECGERVVMGTLACHIGKGMVIGAIIGYLYLQINSWET
jgi:hypothetical protein